MECSVCTLLTHGSKRRRTDLEPAEGLKYELFYAVTDGCVKCVRWLIEQGGVSALDETKHSGFSAVDIAAWVRRQIGKDDAAATEILMFLREAAQNAGGLKGCPDGVNSHWQNMPRRDMEPAKRPVYQLFNAITVGCQECVRVHGPEFSANTEWCGDKFHYIHAGPEGDATLC